MAARSSRVLRRQAVRLLERFGILAPPVPIEVIARNLGAEVRFLPYEGELAGMLARTDNRVVIGVNLLHHRNRQRFTIAHEIAHLLLHDLETHFDRNFRVRHRDAVSSAAVDEHEIEANRFAAELLMPHAMLMADLDEAGLDVEQLCDIAPLARRYSVSTQAMMHRIAHLAHI